MRASVLITCLGLTLAACPDSAQAPDTSSESDSETEVIADAAAETVADSASELGDSGPETELPGEEVGASPDADAIPDLGPELDGEVGDSTGTDVVAEVESDADTGEVTAQCQAPCDCSQGQDCVDGACVLGPTPVFCCEAPGCPSGQICSAADETASICGATSSSLAGVLVFNEVLSDGEVTGDPNGDDDSGDAVGDEFVEIVNAGDVAIIMDGFTLEETTFVGLPRHTFQAGTTLAPGSSIVVFGGGSAPDDIPGARFEVANAQDVGIAFGLALDDDGDTLTLRDAGGALVAVFAYGPGTTLPAVSDRSYTRSPDVTGPFVAHDDAQPTVLFSPGTQADGTHF